MTSSAADCIFCRIAARHVQADVVAEADDLMAFRDVNPQAPTHVLIIPKTHIPSLAQMTETHTTLLGRAMRFAQQTAQQCRLLPEGYRVVVNCGPQAGQSVLHFHLHVLGGRPMRWPPG